MRLDLLYNKLREADENTRTIACDFDGTIATYDGWKGAASFGEPIKKTINALKREDAKGSRIIIHTCRTNPDLQEDGIDSKSLLIKWLNDNAVPYDEIWVGEGKPIADEYWDDRCINIKDI